MLKTTLQCQALDERELNCVNVDRTVQEKAIAFPTAARLYDKARCVLVRAAKQQAIKLRQSDVRVGKQAMLNQSRYAAARQGKPASQHKKLRTMLGRVMRDIERKVTTLPEGLQQLLERAKQIHQQQKQDCGLPKQQPL